MKICKVKPSYSRCTTCLDIQQMNNVVEDCDSCTMNNKDYELLQIGTGFWSGDYAMVQSNGKIEKVALNRVYDVREVVVK